MDKMWVDKWVVSLAASKAAELVGLKVVQTAAWMADDSVVRRAAK